MAHITSDILLKAYASGIFPMAENANDPGFFWVEPDFRGILPLDGFHVSRSLAKRVRQQPFEIRVDHDFRGVMAGCAEAVKGRPSTWINDDIKRLYGELFDRGFCHSVECWQNDQLVGGLYGVSIGAAFFGESMFSRQRDASKVALVHLVARLRAGNYQLLDAQFINDHLVQFGAAEIDRCQYQSLLESALQKPSSFTAFDRDDDPAEVLARATN